MAAGRDSEGVPGDEPGARPAGDDDADGMIQAEGPDVETSFSDDDQAFLDGLSAPGGETTAPTEVAGAEDDHLADLRRLSAEYANYRRRVERDRVVERERAVGDAARAILPVLDDLDRAEAHGDLAEGGALTTIASKLRAAVGKLGIVAYGAAGEVFDPREHDAIFQRANPAVARATVSDVVERGYRIGDTVLRVAKVVVDAPADSAEG